jgi:hypothetical protein
VRAVHEVQAELLDRPYLSKWLKELKIEDLWQRVIDEAESFELPDKPL